jgi:hypothetical protein
MEEIDFSKVIEKILLNNNKHKSIIDNEKIRKNLKKWMISGDEYKLKDWVFTDSKGISIDDTLMGFSISGGFVIFSKNEFCITNGMFGNPILNKFNIEKFRDLKIESDGTTSESVFLDGKRVGNFNRQSIGIWNNIVSDIIPHFDSEVRNKLFQKEKEEKIRLENIEQKRLKDLKKSQTNVLSELDKDGNGIIDVIEGGDDFMKLFRKHQSVIKEFDKEYINHLVKISNYLKTKRSNIQEIFLKIRKTKNQSQLEENVGLLKNQIHTYEVVLFHSLSLITSIVEDDLITVNEIYEEFDKLKMFKTDHEKEVSQKLSDIGDGLSTLMYSINSMERNIVSGLNTLSYVTQDGFSDLNNSLSRELQSIDSSIQSNNLLNTIQTYQLYKINKQTKGLIG